MSAARPPLLTRLRRRLRGFSVLFAVLLLAKITLATACAIDDLPQLSDAPAAWVQVLDTDDATDAADTGCWHAKFGGCHCSCSHSTVFPVAAPAFAHVSAGTEPPLTRTSLAPSSPPDSQFRPPIA